jgi:hypothetical protein
MTEGQIKKLGFKLVKQYEHDQFNTNRYQKGLLEVEFTYEGEELKTTDLTIQEINCIPITFNDLDELDTILNQEN